MKGENKMTPIEQFMKSCSEQHLHAGLDDLSYGIEWLSALEKLANNATGQIDNRTLQEEIIYMSSFTRIMSLPDQQRYMEYCEKLLPLDCILEILDKNPALKYNYNGTNSLVRSYLSIMI